MAKNYGGGMGKLPKPTVKKPILGRPVATGLPDRNPGKKKAKAQVLATQARPKASDGMKWSDWIKQRQALVKAFRTEGTNAKERQLIRSVANGDKKWKAKAMKQSSKGRPGGGFAKPAKKYGGPASGRPAASTRGAGPRKKR